MSKNTFDTLANLGLYVCHDPTKPPSQWIYAVDDSWLHFGWEGKTEFPPLRPVFDPSILTGQNGETLGTKEHPWGLKDVREKLPTGEGKERQDEAVELENEGAEKPNVHPDGPVVRKLLEFTEDSLGRYGICFCSFEFFWSKINQINRPENAVLFDIRHQLARSDASAGLIEDWQKAFDSYWRAFETGTVSPFTFEFDLLGFHLYFALKLGWIPGAPERRIGENHLLILSSNLFETAERESVRTKGSSQDYKASLFSMLEEETPNTQTLRQELTKILDERDRGSAFQSFLRVQKAVWDRIATGDGSKYKGLDFTIIPVPKSLDGGLLDTSLAILNNTLKKAASWKAKEKALLEDIKTACTGFGSPTVAGWGHVEMLTDLSSLRSVSWLPADDGDRRDTLRSFYLCQWRLGGSVSLRTLREFLIYVADRDAACFATIDDAVSNKRVFLPTRPGVLFALALGLFLRALDHRGKERRSEPQIRFKSNEGQARMEIQIGDAGVLDLKKKFFACKPSGAACALRIVAQAQAQMLEHVIAEDRLGEVNGVGYMELRQKLVEDEVHACLDVAKTHPIFASEQIVFLFPECQPVAGA